MQNTGLKRKTVDKYYTSDSTVTTCINHVENKINIGDNDVCIEPSAGGGAFIPEIKRLFSRYTFYDIAPNHPEIIKHDYLTLDISSNNMGKIHVIGNPPFGRQSSTAIKFIKKSADFADSISFILPRSFKKSSLKKHFPLSFHLVCEVELPNNSFTINGETYDVPSIFQIWLRRDVPRIVPVPLKPNGYRFVKKNEDHDISFRRVGVYAGEIDRDTSDKSIQSHYFIKFASPLTTELYEILSRLNYNTKSDTVGPRSISKQDLIKEFQKVI